VRFWNSFFLAAVMCGLPAMAAETTTQTAATTITDTKAAESTSDAPLANPPLNVAETNKDANGNIKVHEQGVVMVTGTVNVGNTPATQNVRVTNTPLAVTGNLNVTGGTSKKFQEEFFPFDKDQDVEVDITEFTRVRLRIVVNGSDSTVDVFYGTDAGIRGSFSVDTADDHTVLLPDVAGTKLFIQLRDPDGEQVFVQVFGTR